VLQAELAERIQQRVPSMELVRFTNSGTEAVMMAIRAARAFTGRAVIVKASEGYHGCWEQVVGWSDEKSPPRLGAAESNYGVPVAVSNLIRSVTYNDPAELEATMRLVGEEVAAIILEPVLGHTIVSANPGYLQLARELADRYGALFVLDEIVTLRLSFGGMQSEWGVLPDLTTLGKIIGGGFPVGAFGGRRDIMAMFDPRRPDAIEHHGTFNGHQVVMAAGCAYLDLLPPAEIDRINELGSRLAAGLMEAFQHADLPVEITHEGSLVNLHASMPVLAQVHEAALHEGIYSAPRGLFNVSTAMSEGTIDLALDAMTRSIERTVTRMPVGSERV
jgi:glutamate-1-semialdehyde 2,1-aminomutase